MGRLCYSHLTRHPLLSSFHPPSPPCLNQVEMVGPVAFDLPKAPITYQGAGGGSVTVRAHRGAYHLLALDRPKQLATPDLAIALNAGLAAAVSLGTGFQSCACSHRSLRRRSKHNPSLSLLLPSFSGLQLVAHAAAARAARGAILLHRLQRVFGREGGELCHGARAQALHSRLSQPV